MNKKQKFNVFLFAILGVLGVVFGVYQIYLIVYGPFIRKGEIKSITELNEESQIESLRYGLSLQYQDSDDDGLSDYDELYTYGTSPYVEDTDSDGVADRTELENGDDPLCPKHADCSGTEIKLPGNPADALIGQVPDYPDVSLPETMTVDMTPDQMRGILRKNGFSQDQIDAFSDEQLMSVWQEVMVNAEAELPFE